MNKRTKQGSLIAAAWIAVCLASGTGAYWLGNARSNAKNDDHEPSSPQPVTILPEPRQRMRDLRPIAPMLEPAIDVRKNLTLIELLDRIHQHIDEATADPSTNPEIKALLLQLRLTEIDDALAHIEAYPEHERKKLRHLILLRWGALDGMAAMEHALAHTPNARLRQAIDNVLTGWAGSDPEGAFAWYREVTKSDTFPGGKGRLQSQLWSIFSNWASQDFDAAFEALTAMESKDDRRSAWFGLAKVVGIESYRDDLLENARGIEDRERYDEAMSAVLSAWAFYSPVEAASWIEKAEFEPRERQRRQFDLGTTWVQSDPATAANWLLSQTDDRWRGTTISMVGQMWAHRDPNALAAWIIEIGLSEDTDMAVRHLVSSTASLNPKNALEWARRITDERSRIRAMKEVVTTWERQAPGAATAHLQSIELSEAERQAVGEMNSR